MASESLSLTWISLLFFILFQTGLLIYRLYFHPLAKFPGPKLAAASFYYELFYDLFAKDGGDFINHIDALHDNYGPVLRVTPDEIHIKDTEWSHVLYAGISHIRHKDPTLAHVAGTGDGTFGTVDHDLHRKRRGPVASYFSRASVSGMQDVLWGKVERMCEVLRQSHAEDFIIPARALFISWSSDSLRTCAFEKCENNLDDPVPRSAGFDRILDAFGRFYPFLKQSPWIIAICLRLPTSVFQYIWGPLAVLLRTHNDMIEWAVESREEHLALEKGVEYDETDQRSVAFEADGKIHKNLFQALLTSSIPESEKQARRMAHESFEVLLAGTDTTARTMGIILFHVLANPVLCTRLTAEVRNLLPVRSDRVDLAELEALPLLNACIKEALRIGRVTDHRLSLIAPDEDLVYGQWVIPRGSCISQTPTRNGYDPNFFPNPEVFDPDRWLQSPETVAVMEKYFMPFAHGRRACLGLFFAQAELRIATAKIFREFELELVDTIRERDIDHTWAHIAGEPSRKGKGLRFKVVHNLDEVNEKA